MVSLGKGNGLVAVPLFFYINRKQMKTYFLILVVAIIAVQSFHAYYVLDKFNRMKTKAMREIQNILFCSILGFGILGFALLDQVWYALAGAIIETIINVYYMESGLRKNTNRMDKFIAYFLAVVFPMTIYFFSETYASI